MRSRIQNCRFYMEDKPPDTGGGEFAPSLFYAKGGQIGDCYVNLDGCAILPLSLFNAMGGEGHPAVRAHMQFFSGDIGKSYQEIEEACRLAEIAAKDAEPF